jgi:integrase
MGARVIGKLSTVRVREATKRGLHGDGGGLFLQISKSGARSWVFRFKETGRLRVMGLGPAHTISLAEARERARQCRVARLDGIDPIEQRRAARAGARLDKAKAVTFRECADAYIAAHRVGWRHPKSEAQWTASLTAYAFPILGALPVAAIDTGLVMRVLEPIWATKPETAGRVRGRIELVLGWAATRGFRTGENPARWRGHLENLLPKKSKVARVEHHPAAHYGEIGAFIAELRQRDGVPARALEFLILTAARTGEVTGARWDEINLADRVWIVPGSRMKGAREHRVPLSEAAMAVVEKMAKIRHGDRVCPGQVDGRPIANTAFLVLLRRMGRGNLTAHGFRSTFRDWCAERTAFPAEVAEMALAHAVGDKVEAAYRRGDLFDKRWALADAWARFCDAPSPVTDGEKVVALRR